MKKLFFGLLACVLTITSIAFADFNTTSNTTLNTGSKNTTTSVLNTNVNAATRTTGVNKSTGSYQLTDVDQILGISKSTGSPKSTGAIGIATNTKYKEQVQKFMTTMSVDLVDMKNRQSQVSVNKKEDPICTQTAISKREGLLAIAFDSYVSAMQASLKEREVSLKTAYGNTDKTLRVKEVVNTKKAFNKNSQDAHLALKDARKNIYATFKTDAKACGATSIDSEPNQEPGKINI